MRGVDYGFGSENLSSEFGDLVEKHRFNIFRGEGLGLVKGFVVGVTEEEGYESESRKTG